MSKPKHITLDRKNQRLVIQWADGSTCDYALNVLREACPCADCRGGHANMGKPPDIELAVVWNPENSSPTLARAIKLLF